jgi:pyrroline-5-carboxylate reductase
MQHRKITFIGAGNMARAIIHQRLRPFGEKP